MDGRDFQKQEAMDKIVELINRTGLGFTVYFYPSENETSRQEVEKVALESSQANVILIPSDHVRYYRIEHVPPNVSSLQVLRDLVENAFGNVTIIGK